MAATHLRPATVRKRVLNRGLTANQSGSDCRLHQVRGGREFGHIGADLGQDQLYAEPSGAGISSRRSIAGSVCRAAMVSSTMIWPGPPPAALALVSPLWLPRNGGASDITAVDGLLQDVLDRSGRLLGSRCGWCRFDPAEGVNPMSSIRLRSAWWSSKSAGQGLDQGAVFDPHPAAGQVSDLSGVALASDQRLKQLANRHGV